MHNQLYLFTEKEVKQIFPDAEKNSTKIYFPEETIANEQPKKDTFCELLQAYRGKIFTRADLKLIPEKDTQKIKEKYQSLSLFLKKVKGLI